MGLSLGTACGCEEDETLPDADIRQEEQKLLQLEKILVETAKLLGALPASLQCVNHCNARRC